MKFSLTKFTSNKHKGLECLNCGQPLLKNENFCSYCGQKNVTNKLSLSSFINSLFEGFLSYDSRFWNTFLLLLTKPGKVSKDYVEGMWLMLQQEKPQDFVIATGQTTTVREYVRKAFLVVGIEIEFQGENEYEIARILKCNNPKYQIEIGATVIKVDPNYYRPTEVDLLVGDASLAKEKLSWSPRYKLDELIKEMVESDVNKILARPT
mgnify:CR=1 FL=1